LKSNSVKASIHCNDRTAKMPRSTTKFDGVPISPPVFITASNNRGVKKLYPVFKDKKTDAHLLQCEECGRFISLPGNRSLVRMEKHIRSQECSRAKTKQERWRVEEQVRAEASAALAASGLQHKALPTKALSRAVKSVHIVQARASKLLIFSAVYWPEYFDRKPSAPVGSHNVLYPAQLTFFELSVRECDSI
jgi:hypothetical protein